MGLNPIVYILTAAVFAAVAALTAYFTLKAEHAAEARATFPQAERRSKAQTAVIVPEVASTSVVANVAISVVDGLAGARRI